MEPNSTTIRASKQSWPFSDKDRVRLEFVYSFKTLKGGKRPTTKAIFRNLSSPNKELSILEMDWLSLPRLTPGRVFTTSPHISDGMTDSSQVWIDVPPAQEVDILTLKEAQSRLGSKTLLEAFSQDPLLPQTKVFRWVDRKGHEYWLPSLEAVRKLFVRSPEIARSIAMYNGLGELIQDHFIHKDALYIKFTDRPKTGDIPLLSLIATNPLLLACWESIAKHLPRAPERVAINCPWPFEEGISILAISKSIGSKHWIQELIDVRGFSVPFRTIVPAHPNYVSTTVDNTLKPRPTPTDKPEDDKAVSSESEETAGAVSLDTTASHISRPKKFIHIQSNSLSELDMLEVTPEYKEKAEKPTLQSDAAISSGQTERPSDETKQGHLSDNISSSHSPKDDNGIGIGTRENQGPQQHGGLEDYFAAIEMTISTLGKDAILDWIVPGTTLKKPDGTGSRWFLKLNNGTDRAWCLVQISYKGNNFYLLEIGRDKNCKKFSLSTIFIRNKNPGPKADDWIKKMIGNNGHWDREEIAQNMSSVEYLPHKQKQPQDWGYYLERKILSVPPLKSIGL